MFAKIGDIIHLKLTPTRKLYYENDFGVYSCTTDSPEIKLNTYGNFVINGIMQELPIGIEHKAKVEVVKNKKYGVSYDVHNIRQELPTTIEGQKKFLSTILTESQFNLIYDNFDGEDVLALIKENRLDYTKVKGLGESTFEKIKTKINENIDIQEVLVELSEFGVTYAIVKSLLKQFNHSQTLLVKKVKENPYMLCQFKGLGFLKVDQYALRMGIKKDSIYRITAAFNYLLSEMENEGHCWINKNDSIIQIAELTESDPDLIEKMLNNDSIKGLYINDKVVAREKTYKTELAIAEKIEELMSTKDNFKVKDLELIISKIEEEQGFKFTEEQLKAIHFGIKYNVVVISGKAGAGKTAIIKGIVNVLKQYTYTTCALSGRAAQRITESTGLDSGTIHRTLGFKPETGFSYNKSRKLPHNILISDETSMDNSFIFNDLIQAIAINNKLILVGDIKQLSAIGCGSPFLDIILSGTVPLVELTQVHRQALKSGILWAANEIRDGKQIFDKGISNSQLVGENEDLILIPKFEDEENEQKVSEVIFEEIIERSKIANKKYDLMDFQVITPLKNRGTLSCKNLNKSLQSVFNDMDKKFISRSGYDYRMGDKVIKNGNDYESGVFNGTLGIIVDLDVIEKYVTIDFFGDTGKVTYSKDQMDHIELAYAITTHRFQGSQVKYGIYAVDYSAYKMLSKQQLYTGLTRFSKTCEFIFEPRAVKFGITQDHTDIRRTFLKHFLKSKLPQINN